MDYPNKVEMPPDEGSVDLKDLKEGDRVVVYRLPMNVRHFKDPNPGAELTLIKAQFISSAYSDNPQNGHEHEVRLKDGKIILAPVVNESGFKEIELDPSEGTNLLIKRA